MGNARHGVRCSLKNGRLEFRLGAGNFGIDGAVVRGVSKATGVVPCQRSERPVQGLVRYKGRTIPVIDLGTTLGESRCKTTSKSRLIVAETENGELAFVVDEVHNETEAAFALVTIPDGDFCETLSQCNLTRENTHGA